MALDFNATGRYVGYPYDELDNLCAGQATFWAWVYRTADGANQHVFTKDGAYPSGFGILIDADGVQGQLRHIVFRGATFSDATDFISTGGTVPLNQWTFIAVTHDESLSGSARARLYVGSLNSPATEVTYTKQQGGTGSVSSDTGYLFEVGNLSRGNEISPFLGSIARAGVHSAVLTLDQLRRIQRLAWIEQVRDIGPRCLIAADYVVGDTTQPANNGRDRAWRGVVTGGVVAPHLPVSLLSVPAPPWRATPRLARSTGATNYTLSAQTASVSATAPAATVTRTRVVQAVTQAVQATTASATLLYARILSALTAAAVITGQSVSTLYARMVSGLSAAWAVTTSAASALYGRVVGAQAQSVDVIAPTATLTYSGNTGPSMDERRKVFLLMGVYK